MTVFMVGSFQFISYNGNYYSTGVYDNIFFLPYLKIYNNICVMAKVRHIKPNSNNPILDSKIEILEIPYSKGIMKSLWGLMSNYYAIRSKIQTINNYILRVSQIESNYIYLLFLRNKRYMIEVVNDPSQFKTNYFFKFLNSLAFKSLVKNATVRSFVTKHYLQDKYVKKQKDQSRFDTFYSSAVIEDVNKRVNFNNILNEFKIVHVANNLEDNTKGTLETILILNELLKKDSRFYLEIIGDGNYVSKIRRLVYKLHISEKVKFKGRIIVRSEYLNVLSNNHLLLLPTKFEGLPRTIIEAMSLGMPVIASNISGIPELIDQNLCISKNEIYSYVEKINRISIDVEMLEKISLRNLANAAEYQKDILFSKKESALKYYSNIPKG